MDIKSLFFGQGGGVTSLTTLSGVGGLVSLFLNIAFVVAGLILIFYFIFGGISLIGSAGANDPQKIEEAKKTVTSALIGLIIVFASFWIVKLILQLVGLPNLI